jgi:hypothetical protein
MKYINIFLYSFIIFVYYLSSSLYSENIFDLTTDYERYNTRTNNTAEIDIDDIGVSGKVSMPDVSCSNFFNEDTYKKLFDSFNLNSYMSSFLERVKDTLTSSDSMDLLTTKLVNAVLDTAAEEYAKRICAGDILQSIQSGELVVTLNNQDNNLYQVAVSPNGAVAANEVVTTAASANTETINLSGASYECLQSIALQSDRGGRIDSEAGTWIPPRWPPHVEPWIHAGLPLRNIGNFGNMIGFLLSTQQDCADVFQKEFKSEQYNECLLREKKKFIEMTNDFLNSEHNFKIDERIRLQEECILDQSRRETDLGYLIHGSESNTLTYKDSINNSEEFKHNIKDGSSNIRLPNGAIMNLSSADFKFIQTDDFLSGDERVEAFEKVMSVYEKGDSEVKSWKDFMIYNIISSVSVVTDIDNREKDYYRNKFEDLYKNATEYEKSILMSIFKDEENNMHTLDDVIKNCVTTLNFVKNRYTEIINNPTRENLLINSRYDVYHNIDLLKIYNEITYYFCSNYVREYKVVLLNYIGDYNGFIAIDENLKTNKELMQVVNMNFEKMQKQVGLLADNKELIDNKYRDIIALYPISIGYFKTASFTSSNNIEQNSNLQELQE